MSSYIGIESNLAVYYLIDLLIIIAIISAMRPLAGVIGNVSSSAELTQRDNAAFGISIAGATLGLAVMLMGAVSGGVAINPVYEGLIMLGYGGVGIVLMAFTRKVFDVLSMPRISIHHEIINGNIAAALIDAGNMIATAIILRAIMVWVDSNSWFGLVFVLVGFLFSQIIMLVATAYRRHVFKRRHNGEGMQDEIAKGNTALALRFAGHRIGIALAVTAASGTVIYGGELGFINLAIWAVTATVMFFILTIIAVITRKAVLLRVDVAEEVDIQQNVAIGAIEAAIYIAIGFLLAGLFG